MPSLTERETEILRHVAKGLTAKQIADRLSLSHRTVENHVQATFRKLQVANRVELARYAIEHGLDRTRNSRVVLLIRIPRHRATMLPMTEPHRAVIARLSSDFAAISQYMARVSTDLTTLDRVLAAPPAAPAPYWPQYQQPQYAQPQYAAAAPHRRCGVDATSGSTNAAFSAGREAGRATRVGSASCSPSPVWRSH